MAAADEDASILLEDSELWKDLTPIPQDDGPVPVVPIILPPEFVKAMDLFRALLKADERSQRALDLTTVIIELNPANYTAWDFRRLCLFELKADLEKELAWVAEKALESPKNYQIWHHRQCIVQHLNQPGDELTLSAQALHQDDKNYHVWSHRQWILQKFNLWENEIAFVDRLLDSDVRNNSAWSHRYFAITQTTGFTKDIVTREIQYTANRINEAINNESSWNYMGGLMRHADEEQLATMFKGAEAALERQAVCVFGRSLLIDLLTEKRKSSDDLKRAITECHKLAKEYDTVRERYWLYRARQIELKLQAE